MEMGGMFTVVKIREGLARGDYNNPGWYKHPQGTVAYEWNGAAPVASRAAPPPAAAPADKEIRARKPTAPHKH
jgi:hypothetical protein